MIKKSILSVLFLLAALMVCAAPARREWITVVLQSGESVLVTLVGDETGSWLQTQSGEVVLNLGEGVYRYATADEEMEMKNAARQKREENDERRMMRLNRVRAAVGIEDGSSLTKKQGITFAQNVGAHGNKKGLVILVNFTDCAMLGENVRDDYDRMYNEIGYSDDNHVGSVKDYFYDQSYGMLNVDFDVVGPVTVSEASTYYGQSYSAIGSSDRYAAKVVCEAVDLVDDFVDFSDYDWDGDGEVNQVLVVYAGCGANFTGNSDNLIWPQEWTLSSAKRYDCCDGAMYRDGMKIDTYALVPEIYGSTADKEKKRYGIGVACHEFSHCLGFPDVYDTKFSGGFGMMAWDVLDEGHYSGPEGRGERPVGMTALERWMAGWLTPIVIDDASHVKEMPCIGDEPVAYIIYNEGNTNEAYLVENHYYKSKWFSYVDFYDCSPEKYNINGVLVLHLDYDEKVWESMRINDDSNHQRYTVVPASNSFGTNYGVIYNLTGDDYRGQLYGNIASGNNTELSRTSLPATRTFVANVDGEKMLNIDLTAISQNAESGLGSFDAYSSFMPACATPTIRVENGKCRFECATEGAKCHHEFSIVAAGDESDTEVSVPQVKVRVYATADNYRDSAVAEYVFCTRASDSKGDVNDDGSVNVADVTELIGILLGY